MVQKLDEDNITDSDFSVMITDLPTNIPKSKIRDLLTWAGVYDSRILYINMCYNFAKITKFKKQQNEYLTKLSYLKYHRNKLSFDGGCVDAENMYPKPSLSLLECKMKKFPS